MGRKFMIRLFCGFVGIGILFLLLGPAEVQAAGVVTNCTGTGLANAMNSGSGLITFNCGPTPVVLTLTQPGGFNVIPGSSYTIDGGDKVTLTGAGANRLFDIQAADATLKLTNIILIDGNASVGGNLPTQGGAILNEGGQLELDHVTIRSCQSTFAGGAIEDVSGTTTVQNSLIEDNQSAYGGAIDSGGTLTLINTIVQNNQATAHEGGGLDVGGTVVIINSQINGNKANSSSFGGGGGLNIISSGNVEISGSQFNGNTTPMQTTAADGGAIRNLGSLSISQSTVNGNSANDGGGIFNDGTSAVVVLNNVILSGNSSYIDGGGIFNADSGRLTLSNVTFSGNSSSVGGGLYNNATATVYTSTFSGNSASDGGGLYNVATAKLTNTTLSGNTVLNQGGAIYNSLNVSLVNVTLSNNSAHIGGALFMQSGTTTALTNTILAYSSAGGNCGGTFTAAKFSLSSDNSCALTGLVNGHNPNGLDPLLTGLGNFGGPTLTHMLKLGSPAIAGVVGNDAPAIDQRGQPRPGADGNYDIGAIERQPGDSSLPPGVYLPLVMR